jgi:hypothetical protein
MGEALGIQGRRPMSSALLPGPALRDEDTFLAGAQGSTGESYAGRNGVVGTRFFDVNRLSWRIGRSKLGSI